MKTRPSLSRLSRQRGSAMIVVILFSFMLLTLAASIIRWAVTERRLNSRAGDWLEARNAAEAAAEYGCYQVAGAFSTKMNPTFGGGGVVIGVPAATVTSFFTDSRTNASTITGIEVKAGAVTPVPSSGLHYIDPNDPNNKFDPLNGRWVNRRDVTVLSKATVTPAAGQGTGITSYIMERVSIRGAPLFAYAIFYSGNDLEVNPLPDMDIYGPVHVNGNMFVGSVSNGVSPNFHGPVTMSGNIYHAWRGVTSTAQEGGSGMSSTSAVKFATEITGTTLFDMRTAGGVWNDSTMGNSGTSGLANLQAQVTAARTSSFAAYASQKWQGFLQTAAHGIQPYNPMGFSEIVAQSGGNNVLATDDSADDGSVVGTGAGYGHGYGPHSLIEAPLAPAAGTDPYASAKAAIEEQKFSNKAGLYIQVQVNGTSDLVGSIKLYGDPRSAPAGTPAANIGPNGGLLLGTAPSDVVQYIKYTTTTISAHTYVKSGMYDNHQDKGVNLVQIDMGALRTALNNMTSATVTPASATIYKADGTTKWGTGNTADPNNKGYDPYTPGSYGYNGGIFVDVINASTANHTAVVVANGVVASGSSLVPEINNIKGITLATNAPVYILGHFNADGSIGSSGTSNSAAYPDDSASGVALTSSKEAPAAIAADAVTILSPDYFGTAGGTKTVPATQTSGSAYNSRETLKPTASASTEIAAALISGSNTTPSASGGTQEYSGGVHNMPRFLESWSSKTVAIRGSLVSMYNTRIATGLWSADYYNPPNRQWGFDQLFAYGTYPPIVPNVISYRRVDFTYIKNATDYATEVAKL